MSEVRVGSSEVRVTATEGLLPCPFCGGRPIVRYLTTAGIRTHSRIECTNCHVKTDYYVHEFGERNVTKVWNRRAV